jgi:predicted glycosyltransferase
MKIMIDIGHPAHVHYFKNFIKIMNSKGHNLLIIARDKEITYYLLDALKINYFKRGKGRTSILGKIFYIIEGDYKIYKLAKKFKPDISINFTSVYAAHVSKILGIPCINIDDTEHTKYEHLMFIPFTDVIMTPRSYRNKIGKKQIYFDGTMDLCYLHPKYFQPDIRILSELGLNPGEKFVFIRFVSWKASHDVGEIGINYKDKIKLINELSKYFKIFLSSEDDLPYELLKYKIKMRYEEIHNILYYASLYIGESTSMATEAATLGTPAICVNSRAKYFGVFDEFIKYNLIEVMNNIDKVISRTIEILNIPDYKDLIKPKLLAYLKNKIDVTAILVWFVENYPNSFRIMKENPDYQYKFK